MTPCDACPLRRCDAFLPFTPKELTFQKAFKRGERAVTAGRTVLMQGESSPFLYTILKGLGLRSVVLPDGQRQVVSLLFPGDFIGLQSGLMTEMGHSIEATTDMVLCVFERGDLFNLFNDHPDRAYDLTWLAAISEHFLGEALAVVGQRDAISRMAWAFARSLQYGRSRGLTTGWDMHFPFTQRDLADTLGLSLVHTNKTLARLRTLGLVEWSQDRLTILDPARLFAIAELPLEMPKKRPLF